MKQNFLFNNEEWLLAIPVISIVGWLLWRFSRKLVQKRLQLFFSARFAKTTLLEVDQRVKMWRYVLSLVILTLLVLAMARPLTGPRSSTAERQGFDFVVALDVSKSMLVEDVSPSRLEAVKADFSEWLKHEAGDRIGLVLFAGDAFVQAPLTFDYNAYDFVLGQAGPKSVSLGGTDVGKAIERAATMLAKTPSATHTLLLISDGEDLKADAVEAARKAHDVDHLIIFTIGVGTLEGGKIPAVDPSKMATMDPQRKYVRDEYGMQAISRKDERTLRAIAAAGGGRYYDFKPGMKTFQTWHDQNLLNLAKKSEKLDLNDYFEWFQVPLLCAIMLLVAEPFIRPQKKRLVASVGVKVVRPEILSSSLAPQAKVAKKSSGTAVPRIVALITLFLAWGMVSGQADPLQDVDQLLKQGKKDEAVALMKKAAEQNSSDVSLYYNYGMTLYRVENYQEAVEVFQTVESTSPDKKMQALALMQMGNALYHLGDMMKQTKKLGAAAVTMERALGNYESLDASDSTRASRTNKEAATTQLKGIMLDLAHQREQGADVATQQDRLPDAERYLRDALQAADRAKELDSSSAEAKQSSDEIRKKLVDNLTQQGAKSAQDADAAQQKLDAQPPTPLPAPAANPQAQPTPPASKEVLTKRQAAVNEYNQALEQDPNNTQVQAARQEQLNKISDQLTSDVEKQTAEPLAKEAPTTKDVAALEQGAKTLAEAQADNPNNQKAQDLGKKLSQKLEQAYIQDGNKKLAATDSKNSAQSRLNAGAAAVDDFQKALDQNPKSQEAQDGLQKAQAKLPDLYAALAKDDLEKAKQTMGAQKGSAAQQQLQKAVGFLEKSTQDYDMALSLKSDNADFKAGLQEAQQMLAASRDQLDKQMQANPSQQPPADPNAPPDPNAENAQNQPPQDPGQALSMTELRSHAKPVTTDKFWNRNIHDW